MPALRPASLQASSKDTGQLAAALHHRILALKSRADQETEPPAATVPEAEVSQSNEEDSDEDQVANTATGERTGCLGSYGGSLIGTNRQGPRCMSVGPRFAMCHGFWATVTVRFRYLFYMKKEFRTHHL